MNKYIMVKGSQAVTIIVTEDKEKSEQELFCTLVPITEDLVFGIDWYWDGNTFTPPEEPEIIEE